MIEELFSLHHFLICRNDTLCPCLLPPAHAEQAVQRCKNAGLLVVEQTCPAIELQRQSQQQLSKH
jgi:hypothetical protein